MSEQKADSRISYLELFVLSIPVHTIYTQLSLSYYIKELMNDNKQMNLWKEQEYWLQIRKQLSEWI